MPLKTDTLDEPQLNLTPMIDVVFLLIIFFMVGARFTEEAHDQQFDVELPKASPVHSMSREPDPMVIAVRQNGAIFLNQQETSLPALLRELKAARATYANQAVLIRGDGKGNYQSIVDIMNVCHQAQIHRFSLAFQPVETGSSTSP